MKPMEINIVMRIPQKYYPDVDLGGLCMNELKGDGEVYISNRKRTVRGREGSMAIIDRYFVISFWFIHE